MIGCHRSGHPCDLTNLSNRTYANRWRPGEEKRRADRPTAKRITVGRSKMREQAAIAKHRASKNPADIAASKPVDKGWTSGRTKETGDRRPRQHREGLAKLGGTTNKVVASVY